MTLACEIIPRKEVDVNERIVRWDVGANSMNPKARLLKAMDLKAINFSQPVVLINHYLLVIMPLLKFT